MIALLHRWLASRRARAERNAALAAEDATLWDEHRDMVTGRFTGNGWPGEGGGGFGA